MSDGTVYTWGGNITVSWAMTQQQTANNQRIPNEMQHYANTGSRA